MALSIMLAGCTSGTSSRPPTTTAASAPAPVPPAPAELCGGPTTPAQSLWLSAPGGALVYAAVVGTGPATAAFVHQAGTTGVCGFWPYADWLARTKGSAGGIVALQVAASIRPPVDAVVDLSGVRSWMGLDSLAAARRLQVPALFAVAPGDSYVSVGTMRRLYQAAPVRAKRLVVLAEGAGHGWELLGGAAGTDWSPLAETVAAWIQGRHR